MAALSCRLCGLSNAAVSDKAAALTLTKRSSVAGLSTSQRTFFNFLPIVLRSRLEKTLDSGDFTALLAVNMNVSIPIARPR